MLNDRRQLSRAAPYASSEYQNICEFWLELSMDGDAGETSWRVLDGIQNRVTQALMNGDLEIARSLTAQAELEITGLTEC